MSMFMLLLDVVKVTISTKYIFFFLTQIHISYNRFEFIPTSSGP